MERKTAPCRIALSSGPVRPEVIKALRPSKITRLSTQNPSPIIQPTQRSTFYQRVKYRLQKWKVFYMGAFSIIQASSEMEDLLYGGLLHNSGYSEGWDKTIVWRHEFKTRVESIGWKLMCAPPVHTHYIRLLFEEGLEVEKTKRNTENQRGSKTGPMKHQREIQRFNSGNWMHRLGEGDKNENL